jgi:WD40 repeat protein
MFSGLFSTQGPAVSPSREMAAYIVRSPAAGPAVLILRRLAPRQSVQRILAPEGWQFWGLRFAPDSRLILADTWQVGKGPAEPNARHRVLVYEAASGRLVRTMELDARGGLAFSPDGRLLVVGASSTENTTFGGTRVKAVAVLYDFESGHELAHIEHPWFKTSPGMWGELTGLEFTADGQYLITSTQDVRVWRVERTPE